MNVYSNACMLWSIDIDMKQSNSCKIVMNDGWFNDDTIYILSYQIKHKPLIVIGFGQDIPSSREKEKWAQILKIKQDLNNCDKVVDSLQIYFRFANQYNCNKFTPEVITKYMVSISNVLK